MIVVHVTAKTFASSGNVEFQNEPDRQRFVFNHDFDAVIQGELSHVTLQIVPATTKQ